ncbi:hypothetical protein JCM10212_000657 [Sporobolomyces blumeae]
MDQFASWRNAGLGFAGTPTQTGISTSVKSSQPRRPIPSSSSSSSRQPLLFSLDKTSRVTPRPSAPRPRETQSKLSASTLQRKPLGRKDNRLSASPADDRRSKGKRRATIDEPAPEAMSSSHSSTTEAHDVFDSLLSATKPRVSTSSRWNGRLSRNPSTSSSSTAKSTPSIAREILRSSSSHRRKGVTIEFDGPEVPFDETELDGERERKKRRREDQGGWGRLDLVDSDAFADDSLAVLPRGPVQAKGRARSRSSLELGGSDGLDEVHAGETDVELELAHDVPQCPLRLDDDEPATPDSTRDPSQASARRASPAKSWSTQSSDSASDVQAQLVPWSVKRTKPTSTSKELVPDSDEIEGPIDSDEGGLESEEGERPELGGSDVERGATNKDARATRSDDSGFAEPDGLFADLPVEVLDLSHSSSSPVFARHRPPSRDLTHQGIDNDDDDDDESVPDSQPSSVASHLSLLGSSSPVTLCDPVPKRTRSTSPPAPTSVRRAPRVERPALQPTASGILMPPPPDVPTKRRRLRRGPPPRPDSRVLVEDTQLVVAASPRPHSKESTTPSCPRSGPATVVCEETQYGPDVDTWDPYYRLPSDFPQLDSDDLRLPSPRPLRRPPKEVDARLDAEPSSDSSTRLDVPPPPGSKDASGQDLALAHVGYSLVDRAIARFAAVPPSPPRPRRLPSPAPSDSHLPDSQTPVVGQAPPVSNGGPARVADWTSLASAWEGQRAPTPPPPSGPKQSRLTDHFALVPTRSTTPRDSAQPYEGDDADKVRDPVGATDREREGLEKAWRETIKGQFGDRARQGALRGQVKGQGRVGPEGEADPIVEDDKGDPVGDEPMQSSPLSPLSEEEEEEVVVPASIEDAPERYELINLEPACRQDFDYVVPDSDPSADLDTSSFLTRPRHRPDPCRLQYSSTASPLGTPIRNRFPLYRLPTQVVQAIDRAGSNRDATVRADEEEENDDRPSEGREAEAVAGDGLDEDDKDEETMWESYWTTGTAPTQTSLSALDGHFEAVRAAAPVDDSDAGGDDEGGTGPSDADEEQARLARLLAEAPEDDSLPPGWYEDERGQLVREA